eukprot:15448809-Alexandrium_andersonii.AAC.1
MRGPIATSTEIREVLAKVRGSGGGPRAGTPRERRAPARSRDLGGDPKADLAQGRCQRASPAHRRRENGR